MHKSSKVISSNRVINLELLNYILKVAHVLVREVGQVSQFILLIEDNSVVQLGELPPRVGHCGEKVSRARNHYDWHVMDKRDVHKWWFLLSIVGDITCLHIIKTVELI